MVRAIGFDLDGTLFDDRQYVRHGLNAVADHLLERYGIDTREALFRTYFHRGVRTRTFDAVLDERGVSTDIVPELVEVYHGTDSQLTPFPGIEPTLERLQDCFRLGVLTGGNNGRSKLDRLGITSYFETILVAPEMGVSKRQPEPFEALLDGLRADADEAIYVGDRPELDFKHPNDLGMRTVQVVNTHRSHPPCSPETEPDYELDRVDDLPELVERIDRNA